MTVVTRVSQTAPRCLMMITHLVLFSQVTKVEFLLVGCSPLLTDYGIQCPSSPRTDHICICLADGERSLLNEWRIQFSIPTSKTIQDCHLHFCSILIFRFEKSNVLLFVIRQYVQEWSMICKDSILVQYGGFHGEQIILNPTYPTFSFNFNYQEN